MKSWEYRAIPFEQRVVMHTTPDAATGCHNFSGRCNTSGYGQLKNRGNAILVHRWVWVAHNGPVPFGLCVLHKCDNVKCVNPDHLYVGTHKRNMEDKKERGRSNNVPRGWQHLRTMAKLTEQDVIAIKVAMVTTRKTQEEIGQQYGVTQAAISDIARQKTWRHLNIHTRYLAV